MNLCAVTHRKEDAAQKWCPFAWTRKNDGSKTQFEGNPLDEQHTGKEMVNDSRCLTNGCMAWIDETDYFHGIAIGRCGLVAIAPR